MNERMSSDMNAFPSIVLTPVFETAVVNHAKLKQLKNLSCKERVLYRTLNTVEVKILEKTIK